MRTEEIKAPALLSLKISSLEQQRRKVESVTVTACCKFTILFKLDLIVVLSVFFFACTKQGYRFCAAKCFSESRKLTVKKKVQRRV
jgi:hypothetical protein